MAKATSTTKTNETEKTSAGAGTDKVTQTGRGNGGGESQTSAQEAKAGLQAGVMDRNTNPDTGDREAVSPGDVDRIYTVDSKERWGEGQPTIAEQQAANAKANEKGRKAEKE